MTWNDRLVIGIPLIDQEHKELCEKIDQLYAACSSGKGSEEAMKTLEFLESYTKKHFADEEALQLKIKYPKYQQHKQMHDDFVKQISDMKKDIISSGSKVSMVIQINHVISDWLVKHIMKVDPELKQYID